MAMTDAGHDVQLIHARMCITLDQLDHLKIKVYWKSINYKS